MKALSVRQPWAWALFHGKPVENRDWQYPPKYRGPLAIHASKTFDQEGYSWIVRNSKALGIDLNLMPGPHSFPRGGIIGVVDLVYVVTDHPSPWFFGPLGLVMGNPREIDFQPMNGRLGLFDVPDQLLLRAGEDL